MLVGMLSGVLLVWWYGISQQRPKAEERESGRIDLGNVSAFNSSVHEVSINVAVVGAETELEKITDEEKELIVGLVRGVIERNGLALVNPSGREILGKRLLADINIALERDAVDAVEFSDFVMTEYM